MDIKKILKKVTPEILESAKLRVTKLSPIEFREFIRETQDWGHEISNYTSRMAVYILLERGESFGQTEVKISKLIRNKYGGQTEIKIANVGRIDLLTRIDNIEYMCEVKYFKNWKHALGQVLAYKLNYNNGKHKYLPALILIDPCPPYDIELRVVKKTLEDLQIAMFTSDYSGHLTPCEL